jgi:[Skp1-protein]-hydroxyproline N-acetylglucosaminyltransferase
MEKIFVSIASYRDPELINTVKSVLNNADNADNLRIVVFEQNDNYDLSIRGIFPKFQVKVLRTNYKNAKGPVWARYIIQKKYNNEEYYMQIDSHSRLTSGWDTILKNMLNLLPEPSVLTQYPPEYKLNGTCDGNIIRSGLYIQGFSPVDGFTRIQSDYTNNKRYYPYTSKAWSGCFSFSKGYIVIDAPYDPNLKYLFFGEEMDITLRLFTRGYYFYSPNITVIYTLFDRSYRRTYWQDIDTKLREEGEKKSREYLKDRIYGGILGEYYCDDIFELGNKRSLKDYEKFADIKDIIRHKLNNHAKAFRRNTKKILNK